jgi:regulator of ribosome biosynthesis
MAHIEPKPQPFTFDLGTLLCNDPNPLPSLAENKEEVLRAVARDTAQGLINQLLTTCPITKASDDQSLQLTLPAPITHLPREKPVPKEKEKTKWQKFADKKGKNPEGKVPDDWITIVDDKEEKKAKQIGSKGNVGKDIDRRNKKLMQKRKMMGVR